MDAPDSPVDSSSRSTGPARLAHPVGEALDEPTPLQIAGRWMFNASVAGAIVSIIIHVVFLIAAGRILLSRPAGDSRGADAGIEVAVMNESQLDEIRDQTLHDDPVTINDLEMTEPVQPPDSDMPALDDSISTTGPGDLAQMSGAGAADEFKTPTGAGSVASFFGVEARGSRFAYIVDRSGSMADRDRMDVLKANLVGSINGLSVNTSFMVFFFSGESRALGNRTNWLTVNNRNREMAEREIRGVEPYGGTNPLPAFIDAFNMKPKPDSIYFMTDGIFQEEVAPEVHELNAQSGALTPIHTISFVDNSAEDILRRIARDSGGTYTHIAGPEQ